MSVSGDIKVAVLMGSLSDEPVMKILCAAGPRVTAAFNRVQRHRRFIGAGSVDSVCDARMIVRIEVRQRRNLCVCWAPVVFAPESDSIFS